MESVGLVNDEGQEAVLVLAAATGVRAAKVGHAGRMQASRRLSGRLRATSGWNLFAECMRLAASFTASRLSWSDFISRRNSLRCSVIFANFWLKRKSLIIR